MIGFVAERDIVFDRGEPLPEHPNGLVSELRDHVGNVVLGETYFSIGGGFVHSRRY